MRQPDINRVRKAQAHLEAALTVLNNIKWANTTSKEDALLETLIDCIRNAKYSTQDIINIQEDK